MFQRAVLPIAAALAALVVVACGSSDTTTAEVSGAAASQPAAATSQATSSSQGQPAGGTSVAVANNALGQILVDAQGRTLYLWEGDTGSKSACSGQCASAWPPVVTTGAPVVGSGLNATLLSMTARADGTMQVTYNGHPLYTFIADKAAGDTKGEGSNAFGANWYVVAPSGNKVDNT